MASEEQKEQTFSSTVLEQDKMLSSCPHQQLYILYRFAPHTHFSRTLESWLIIRRPSWTQGMHLLCTLQHI